jgi:hypothetical protein
MARLIAKLMVLAAVLLMPFAMTAVPATVAHQPAAMPMGHCPDRGSDHSKGGFAECTMACSAALPAIDHADQRLLPIACQRVQPTLAERLHGLHPETATPPPKRS